MSRPPSHDDPGLPSSGRRAAVSPHEAYEAVRGAFEAHARGLVDALEGVRLELPGWGLQGNARDRRRARAAQVGHIVPRQSRARAPTVTGLVLLSDAEDGRLLAVLDAAAVTALRTAAAGVLAADTLVPPKPRRTR